MLATLYPNQLGAYEMICSLCTCRQNSFKKIYVYPSIPGDGTHFSSLGRKNEWKAILYMLYKTPIEK